MSSRAELTFITNAMKLNNITIYVKLLGSCMVCVRNVKGIHKTSNFVPIKDSLSLNSLGCRSSVTVYQRPQ
ncbi:hypothetical protein T05_8359 [Trichinella murrelli]|uniref:Uncharacterized protein n=1 Tax=Trichinella murrelli TaxID=144512 RepID=A0A0V0TUX1_9BILA|nr:hypothetical protein T05_8359 [Trichinella murrelli]